MDIQVQIPINGTAEQIWKVITSIEEAENTISGIEKVEVLEKPVSGLVGLKWRETRTMFGKEATEVMWITEAEENTYYQTRAESHGAIYISRMEISPGDNGQQILTMSFGSTAQSFGAKFMAVAMGFMFKSATRKAIMKDLEDIKAKVEQG